LLSSLFWQFSSCFCFLFCNTMKKLFVAAPKKKFEWNENLRYVLIVILDLGVYNKKLHSMI
jgi:hypothetical protein